MGSEEEDLEPRGFQAGVDLHYLGAIVCSICERERERERERESITHHKLEKERKDITYA